MTTLVDRPNTALLVIDMQNQVVAEAHERDAVIANITALVDRARAEGAPVVWVQHHDDDLPKDSDGWQYVPELERHGSEPLVHKSYGDAFEATELEDVLAAQGRSAGRHRSGDGRVHPLDAARRDREGLRRDARERCAHRQRPDRVGRSPA